MAAAEATGSGQHVLCGKQGIYRADFLHTPSFFMLGTKCVNRVNQFASVAEILAREYRGWWSQLYLGMKPTFGARFRGMKPTEYGWSQLHICDELQIIVFGCLLSYNIWLYINDMIITILPLERPRLSVVEGDGFVRR